MNGHTSDNHAETMQTQCVIIADQCWSIGELSVNYRLINANDKVVFDEFLMIVFLISYEGLVSYNV